MLGQEVPYKPTDQQTHSQMKIGISSTGCSSHVIFDDDEDDDNDDDDVIDFKQKNVKIRVRYVLFYIREFVTA